MSAAVEVRGLTKRYDRVTAVEAIDLRVEPGEVYGFLGPNGAGKTTTLRMVLGLIRPTSGTVTVLGGRPGSPDTLRRIGSMVEAPAFYPYLSGHGNLTVLARYAGVPLARLDGVLDTVGLADRAGDRFGTYSLGMKQRLGVAAALLKDPELVILDEPTNGLDPGGMRDMRRLIADLGRQGRTVMLSSHLMAEVEQVCDRVGVINAGRVVAETSVTDIRATSELVIAATPSDVAAQTLGEMPEVEGVTRSGGRLRVRVDDRYTGAVNHALVTAGVAVTELRRESRHLEDVFFEITETGLPTTEEKETSHV